jgi:hypothetical protein
MSIGKESNIRKKGRKEGKNQMKKGGKVTEIKK